MRRNEPKRVVILHGHPDPADTTFCAALTRTYEKAAREAGHEVAVFRIGALDFPILRDADAFYGEGACVPEGLADCQAALGRADHIVFVFPIWLGTLPAYFKAAIEQLWRPGFAMRETGRFPKGLLTGTSARIIATMGMPPVAYRLLFGAHGVRNLRRATLRFSGVRPVRTTYLSVGEKDDAEDREAAIRRVRSLGARGF